MKFFALAVLILVVYLAWKFFVHGDGLVVFTSNPGDRITAVVKRVAPNKEIIIEVNNNGKENRITEISLSRSRATELGLSPPPGFKEEALPLTEKEKNERETVKFVEKFNKETLRWVGNLPLRPDTATDVAFPARSTNRLAGQIKFQYEAKLGLGGSISFFQVDLASQEP